MLTDKHCKTAVCPADKSGPASPTQAGFTWKSAPAGSRRWFWKTYADRKEGRFALGAYPAMSLSDARKAAKLHKSKGRDPVDVGKLEKIKAARPEGDTFKAVAL